MSHQHPIKDADGFQPAAIDIWRSLWEATIKNLSWWLRNWIKHSSSVEWRNCINLGSSWTDRGGKLHEELEQFLKHVVKGLTVTDILEYNDFKWSSERFGLLRRASAFQNGEDLTLRSHPCLWYCREHRGYFNRLEVQRHEKVTRTLLHLESRRVRLANSIYKYPVWCAFSGN